MHNAAFRALGLDYVYVPFRPRQADDPRRRRARCARSASSDSTSPSRSSSDVIPTLDRVSDTARAVGAVNTIVNRDGNAIVGDNTDVPGFRAALATSGLQLRGARVLVIGAGGAARAVLHALLEGGAADVVVANRTRQRATGLAKLFAKLARTAAGSHARRARRCRVARHPRLGRQFDQRRPSGR